MYRIPELLAPAGGIEGVRKAKELGFSRVVLARELTLGEIKDITRKTFLISRSSPMERCAFAILVNARCDLADLSQIFSRGGFTEGNPKKYLMSGDLSKHQGIYIGKVVKGSGVAFTFTGWTRMNNFPKRTAVFTFLVAVLKGFFHGDDRIIPVIPNITKGWHDHNIRENFDKLVVVSAPKGIAVGNLGWIEPFVNSEVNVFGDYGLNLYNSVDFQLANELGIKEAFASHEADLEDILAMDFHGVVPEVAISGKIPVMTSEHCGASDLNFCGKKCEQTNIFLKDRKGQLYPIITNPDDCRSVILSHKETNLLMQK